MRNFNKFRIKNKTGRIHLVAGDDGLPIRLKSIFNQMEKERIHDTWIQDPITGFGLIIDSQIDGV